MRKRIRIGPLDEDDGKQRKKNTFATRAPSQLIRLQRPAHRHTICMCTLDYHIQIGKRLLKNERTNTKKYPNMYGTFIEITGRNQSDQHRQYNSLETTWIPIHFDVILPSPPSTRARARACSRYAIILRCLFTLHIFTVSNESENRARICVVTESRPRPRRRPKTNQYEWRGNTD